MSAEDPFARTDGLAETAGAGSRGEGLAAAAVVPFAPPPRGRAPDPADGTPARAPRADAGPATRVLLIDDREDDALVVGELLARAEGGAFRFCHTADAQDGMARLLRGEHDVALLEQQLGGGGQGLEFSRALVRRGSPTPLILLGEDGTPGLEQAAIEAGAADYLDKEELDAGRLGRAVRMALARRGRETAGGTRPPSDPLTGLADRQAFLDRLDLALARARRCRDGLAAVVLVDIDGFDAINRRFGHEAGDSLLRLTGGRLRRHLRASDTTARLFADRFALILEELARPEHAGSVALKLLAAVRGPATIAGETVTAGASAGVSLFPLDAVDRVGLLDLAEAALRAAKREGGNRLGQPSGSGRSTCAAGVGATLAPALERAIETDALGLMFQPQVTLCSAELGLTALLRWQDGQAGDMADGQVRALAQAAALTEPLTDWLVAAACRQAASWRSLGMPRLHVAVPLLSRRPLAWGNLAHRLERHLAAAGIAPEELELEVDEALLGDDRDAPRAPALAAVRELGVRLAVDRYGCGPTSLALLRDLPLTTVKLARQLTAGVAADAGRTSVAGAVVRLAGELGLRTVAEGVETQAELQCLRQLGCHAVQARICCPPLPAAACADWLRQAARRG